MDEGHTARMARAEPVRAARTGARLRALLRALIGHLGVPKLLLIAGAWSAAVCGFAAYLVGLDSFMEAFGGVGTGVALLLWVTLFSVLYHVTAALRDPPRRAARGTPARVPVQRASPMAARVELVVTPSAALRNTTAQGRMMSILGPRATGLSDHEVDIMDWGFAYGVAWAVARSQDPGAPEEIVSERALHATQAVYEAYRGNRIPMPGNGRRPAPAER